MEVRPKRPKRPKVREGELTKLTEPEAKMTTTDTIEPACGSLPVAIREPFVVVRCAHPGSTIILEMNTDGDCLAVELPPPVAVLIARDLLTAAMRSGLTPDPPKREGLQLQRWR